MALDLSQWKLKNKRAKGDTAGRLIRQKRFAKTHATIFNIHIRPPFYVMYFFTTIIARYNFTEHRTSISTCALERLIQGCGEAGTGLSMAKENVLYSATLDMYNGVKINVKHSWWP